MPKTVAVVVTYNRKELLRRCLCALLAQTVRCDIIVVDNDSSDGTGEMVAEEFDRPEVRYCNTGTNLGGAGGFEYGLAKAVEAGYSYAWMMDDDTIPGERSLEMLRRADKALKGQWGWLSSVAYWTDGSICRMNIQKIDIFRHVRKEQYAHRLVPIRMCSFVSLLVKCDVIKELGLPIGEYFIWTDDYEYTGRISQKYPCYMVPDSRVVHAMKQHIRVDFTRDSADRIERYHYLYRNDVHCYRRYGIAGWSYLILKNIYTCIDIILHSDGDVWKKIAVIWKGFADGMNFWPMVKFPGREEHYMERIM